MKRLLQVIGLGLCVLVLASIPPAQAQSCEGFTSRLQPGMVARVTPGEANNVRAMPSTSSALVGQLPGGSTFLVSEGPLCEDGLTWFLVRNDTIGIAGYTVEGTPDAYWTEPASSDVVAENLAFDFTPVAGDILIELIPPMDYTDIFRGAAPLYLEVRLANPVIGEFIPPHLAILPIADFAALNPDMYEMMALFVDRLRQPGDEAPPTPFIFPWGAARLHESHAAWLESDLMTGVRYVTQYGQYQAPITGGELFYTFQGITRDGRFWVSAILPVTAPRLNQYFLQIESDIRGDNGVTEEGAALLDDVATNLDDAAFFPTLDVLDVLVRSLNFYGAEGLPQPVTTRLPTSYSFDLALIGDAAFIYSEAYDERGILDLYIQETESYAPGWLHVYGPPETGSFYFGAAILDFADFLNAPPAGFTTIPDPINGPQTHPIGEVTVIESENVRGLGYLMATTGRPVLSGVTYRFQGFTRDGAYYLAGGYRIDIDTLPASRDDLSVDDLARATSEDEAVYLGYLADVAQVIASTPPESFSIPVDAVTALFASFSFTE